MNISWHQIYFNLVKFPHRTKPKQNIIAILYEHSPRLNIYYFTFKKTSEKIPNTNSNPNLKLNSNLKLSPKKNPNQKHKPKQYNYSI